MNLQPYLDANAVQPNDVQATAQPKPRTILLVEDESFVREATCGILKHAGFEVLPAPDIGDALQVYAERERTIDLVMTDIGLPGGDGRKLAQDLLQRSPEVVVLVTSGYGNPEFATEAPESRTYFLPKPYSRRTLLEKIEQILSPAQRARPATQAG